MSLTGFIHQVVNFIFFSNYLSGISLILVVRLISYTLPEWSCAGLPADSCIGSLGTHSYCAILSNYISQAIAILLTKIVLIFLNFTRHLVQMFQDYSALQARTCLCLLKFKSKHRCGFTIMSPMCPRNLPSCNAVTGKLSLGFVLCPECCGVFIFKTNFYGQEITVLAKFFTSFSELLQ